MLRFTNTNEWVSHSILHNIEDSESYLAISFNPVAQILQKFWVEDCAPRIIGAFLDLSSLTQNLFLCGDLQ